MNVLIAFVLSMAFLLVSLIVFKMNPSIGLFLAAVVMGVLCGVPLGQIGTIVSTGFGQTMVSLGIVIFFGGVFGDILAMSGASEEMAKGLLRKIGKKNDLLALNLAGFIVSIPMYFGLAYIMFTPLVTSIQKITKKKMRSYTATMFTGMLLTHCVVAPTPGPLAVGTQMGANLGWFILYGIIVALPASLLCGWLYSVVLDKKESSKEKAELKQAAQEIVNDEELLKSDPNKPSSSTALLLIFFPIVLIVAGAIAPLLLPETSFLCQIFSFFGNSCIALFLAMILSYAVLRKYISAKEQVAFSGYFDKACDRLGSIVMILGAGGAFGAMLQSSGLGTALSELFATWNMPMIWLAFLMAMIIRAAVGSATVAMLTTASIVGAAAVSMGFSPVVIGLAICTGTVGLTLPTDGAFWIPVRYGNLSVKESFVATTYNTTLASLAAFAIVLLLNAFAGSLPGMF